MSQSLIPASCFSFGNFSAGLYDPALMPGLFGLVHFVTIRLQKEGGGAA